MRLARLLTVVGLLWGGALAVNRALRRVEGDSMLPTLAPGELVLTVPRRRRPRPGDVVVVDLPGAGPGIKRVVAGPRDDVAAAEGRLVVDGVWQHEPYATTSDDGQWHLPPGEGWVVLGDNRPGSTDTRSFGRVPEEAIPRIAVARVASPRLLAEAPVPMSGPLTRPAVRLLVLDPDDRLLLFRVVDEVDGGTVWMTPGGGRGVGESVVEAASRELAEEVGLPASVMVALDEAGAPRRHGAFAGAPIEHRDDWVAVRVASADVDDSGWTSYEHDEIAEVRWVDPGDLGGMVERGERFLQPRLGELAAVARLATGDVSR